MNLEKRRMEVCEESADVDGCVVQDEPSGEDCQIHFRTGERERERPFKMNL